MYKVSRLLLRIGVALGYYCLAIAVILLWPTSGVIGLIAVMATAGRKGVRRLTTLGSARFADESDLRGAAMMDADSGMILGRLGPEARNGLLAATRALFSWRLSPRDACRAFWSGLRRRGGPLIRLPNSVMTAVFAPTGAGKGVSLIIPFLLTCRESCVVFDVKGENYMLTANHRRKVLGHEIVVLDPYKVVTQTPDSFNPLDVIDKDSPSAIDECNDLAQALVVRSPDEREPHWNDSAQQWISSILATVVGYG